jgi:hypothetical protein
VINLFGIAIRHDLTADDLRSTMFAYPTGFRHWLHALGSAMISEAIADLPALH